MNYQTIDSSTISPPVKIHKYNDIFIVRDDFLPGGTKQRAAIPFLKYYQERNYKKFVYASPFSGYAQIALAKSAHLLNAQCVIFAEKDQTKPGKVQSQYTKSINGLAKVFLTNSLEEAIYRAKDYSRIIDVCIPLGFNHPLYRKFLQQELRNQWNLLKTELGFEPKRLWLASGSGTLANVFQQILPDLKLMIVDVKVIPNLKQKLNLNNYEYFQAEEEFPVPAKNTPPINSNLFYDAKTWQFIKKHSQENDVWWNIA